MKNIFRFINIETIKDAVFSVSKRFPLSVLLIVSTALVFFFMVHGTWTEYESFQLGKAEASLIITFFLSIGISFFAESIELGKLKKYLVQLFPLIFGGLFFLSFSPDMQDSENVILFILSLVGIIGFLFFSPYLQSLIKKNNTQEVYYSYFYRVASVFLLSLILGGVLSILGVIAISTVFTLFDLNGIVSEDYYADWTIIALSVIAPFFGLAHLPKKEEFSLDFFHENVFFSFLVKYIAIPFIYIYFFILYAYSIKVLLNFGDWPKGEVSWIVIGFSSFGYLTYIFSYAFEPKVRYIQLFRKYFPYVVFPQIFMLFYAIYLRIHQYDVTTNRYFVVVFGIWLLIISLYYIISKKKYLIFIPVVLTCFTILVSVGPWSSYNFPESRQIARLKTYLITTNILQGNTIVIPEKSSDIDKTVAQEIYSGISYLCGFNNCESLNVFFAQQLNEIRNKHKQDFEKQKIRDLEAAYSIESKKQIQEREYYELRSWDIVSLLSEKLKIPESYGIYSENNLDYISVNVLSDTKTPFFPIQVSGYTFITEITHDAPVEDSAYTIRIVPEAAKLEVWENSSLVDSASMEQINESILQKSDMQGSHILPDSDLIYDIETAHYKIKLFFQQLSIKNPNHEEGNNEVDYPYIGVNGYALIQKK